MTSLLLFLALVGAAPVAETAPDADVDVTPSARPTVHLVVDEGLTEWLVVRLLEDGYPLAASPAGAQVELIVTASDTGTWSVTAIGNSTSTIAVESSSDPAVMRLELLHRSLDALEDVEPKPSAESQPATVAYAIAEGSHPELAPRVASDILAAGATLVPAGGAAQLRVCANQPDPSQVARISIVEGSMDCGAVADGSGDVTEQVSAAMAALMWSEAEVVESAEPEPEPEEVAEPAVDPERAPGLEPERRRHVVVANGRAPYMIRGGPSVGMIARTTVVDAVFGASMMIGREPGMQGWVELQVRPINVLGQFHVVEVQPAVGFQLRPVKAGRFSLLAGALLGPEIHTWQLRRNGGTSQGALVSVSLEGALGFAIETWKQHEVQVTFRAGGSNGRTHSLDGQEIWRRAPVRVGATVGFMFGRRLR